MGRRFWWVYLGHFSIILTVRLFYSSVISWLPKIQWVRFCQLIHMQCMVLISLFLDGIISNLVVNIKFHTLTIGNIQKNKIIYFKIHNDTIFEWFKVAVRCSYVFVPRNSSIGSWNMSQVCSTEQSARLHWFLCWWRLLFSSWTKRRKTRNITRKWLLVLSYSFPWSKLFLQECIIRLNFPVWPFFFRLCMHWVFGMSKCDRIVTNMSMSTSTTSLQQWDIISTKWIQAAGNRLVKEPFQNNWNIKSWILLRGVWA